MRGKYLPSREQVDIFRKEWPHGCVVNEKNIRRALKLGLDVYWAVECVFPPEVFHSCASKYLCADETWTNLWSSKLIIAQDKINEAARKTAVTTWNTDERTNSYKSYLKEVKAIWKEYEKTIAPARKVYEKARLVALLEVVADKQLMSAAT